MKNLIFVRHSHAEDQSEFLSDFERSLTEKGKIVANEMSALFFKTGIKPDLIITSPAFRAYETAVIFATRLNYPADKIVLVTELYHYYDYKSVLDLVAKNSSGANSVLVFGHNPTISEVASEFSADFSSPMPKCAMAGITFDADNWNFIKEKSGKNIFFEFPKKQKTQ